MTTPHPPPAGPWGAPPGSAGGQSAIALTSILSDGGPFKFSHIQPTLLLNGAETAVQWGRTILPVPPGQHQLQLHVRYPTKHRFGPAHLTVSVRPGETVELEYKTPVFTTLRGALGPPPQRAPGARVALWTIVAILGGGGICALCVFLVRTIAE